MGGSVEMDGSHSRDEVEKRGDLAAKRGHANCVHSVKGEVIIRLVNNVLYNGALEGGIDAVPDLYKGSSAG